MKEIKEYLKLNKFLLLKLILVHFITLSFQFGTIILVLESIQVFVLNSSYTYLTFLDIKSHYLLFLLFLFILISTLFLYLSRTYIVNTIIDFEIYILNKQSNLKRFTQINSLIKRGKITKKSINENFTKETKYLSRAFDASISLILDLITISVLFFISLFFIHYSFHIFIIGLVFLSIIAYNKKGKLIAGIFEKKIKIDFIYRTTLINEMFLKKDENYFIEKIKHYINDKTSSLHSSLDYYKQRLIMVNKTYLYVGMGLSLVVPIFIYIHNQILLVENEKILLVYFMLSFMLIKTISMIANFMKIEYFIKLLNRKYIIWKDN